MALRVAIVHYHLKPGGVTRVIENAVSSLEGHGVQTIVLSGEPYAGTNLDGTRTVPGLEYRTRHSGGEPRELARSLARFATGALGGAPDIWHVHNHSLGKNSAMPGAVAELIAHGGRILFQIHDFAEDGRPTNYAVMRTGCGDSAPYPLAPQIHYAALNARDTAILAEAGVPIERLHTLANPVAVSGPAEGRRIELPGVSRLFLYPTRGIRRKNLGEMVLWSALGHEGDYFASTLAPANPEWLPIHDRWVSFAAELGLPAGFDVGGNGKRPFSDWIANAEALITTSVAEGFGLAFLEPWGFGKPLVGRNLPEITADFQIDLSMLYDRFEVPLECVGQVPLRKRLRSGLEGYYTSYGRTLPADAVEESFESVVRNERADFGCLDESLQEKVIRQVAASPDLQKACLPHSLPVAESRSRISENRAAVAARFGLPAYGERLAGIYRQIAGAPLEKADRLDPARLLDCFLDPARFRLLRS